MRFMLLILLLGLSTPALAQVERQEVEVVVAVPDKPDAPPVWTIFMIVESPCQDVAKANQCAGSTRDIAICLAQTRAKLPQRCANDLMNAALTHGDLEVAQLLALHEHATIESTVPNEIAQTDTQVHEHHGPVHPIVAALRQGCSAEFAHGVCAFANKARVCPRKLLHCLVQNQQLLSAQCTESAREQIKLVASRQDPLRMVCSLLVWAMIMLAGVLICTCCARAIFRCCCSRRAVAPRETKVAVAVVKAPPAVTTYPAPSAPVESADDADLEMALILSATEASKVNDGVANGIPVLSNDQL